MASIPIWQKTKEQRAAAFAAAFADAVPAERKEPSIATVLRLIRPFILQKRQQGFTVEQICEKLKHPDIAIDASPVSIRRILAEAERKRDLRRKARLAALLPKPGAATTKTTVTATPTATKPVPASLTTPGAKP